ncbi:MAG: hypothetical protein SVU88_04090 [Candidatus Nanohaloarchaea archaeon]|nr:hypothetical protein [Candidatus Nanohaloarchaea archaeon]
MAQQTLAHDAVATTEQTGPEPLEQADTGAVSARRTQLVDVATRDRGGRVEIEFTRRTLHGRRGGGTISISEEETVHGHTIPAVDAAYTDAVADVAAAWMATVPLPDDLPAVAAGAPAPMAGATVDETGAGSSTVRTWTPERPFAVAGTGGVPTRSPYAAAVNTAAPDTYPEAGDTADPATPGPLPLPARPVEGERLLADAAVEPPRYGAGVDETAEEQGSSGPPVMDRRYDDAAATDVSRALTYTVPAGEDALGALQQLMVQGAVTGSVEAMSYTVSEAFETRDGEVREAGETVESYFVDIDGSDMRRTEFFVDGELAADPIDAYDDADTVTFVEADRFADDTDYCGGLDLDDVLPQADALPASGAAQPAYPAS